MIINRFPGMSNSGGGNPYKILAEDKKSSRGMGFDSDTTQCMIGDTLYLFDYTSYYTWDIKNAYGWSDYTDVSQGTSGKQSAILNNVIYMFSWYYRSSNYTFYFLKVENGVITSLSTTNITTSGKLLAYNGYIWLISSDSNGPVFRYTISSNTWTKMSFTTPFYAPGATGMRWVVWNGNAYIVERTSNDGASFFRFNGSSFTNLGITAFSDVNAYTLQTWGNLFINNNKLYMYYQIQTPPSGYGDNVYWALREYNGSSWSNVIRYNNRINGWYPQQNYTSVINEDNRLIIGICPGNTDTVPPARYIVEITAD